MIDDIAASNVEKAALFNGLFVNRPSYHSALWENKKQPEHES